MFAITFKYTKYSNWSETFENCCWKIFLGSITKFSESIIPFKVLIEIHSEFHNHNYIHAFGKTLRFNWSLLKFTFSTLFRKKKQVFQITPWFSFIFQMLVDAMMKSLIFSYQWCQIICFAQILYVPTKWWQTILFTSFYNSHLLKTC